jgi:hypothetical protein
MEYRILRINEIHPYDIPRRESWERVNKLRFSKESPYPLTKLGISLLEVAGYILAPDGNHRIAKLYDRGINVVRANIQEISRGHVSYLPQLNLVQEFGIYSFDDYLYCCRSGNFDPGPYYS